MADVHPALVKAAVHAACNNQSINRCHVCLLCFYPHCMCKQGADYAKAWSEGFEAGRADLAAEITLIEWEKEIALIEWEKP